MLQKLIEGEKVFMQTFYGAEGSEIEFFWGGFNYFTKKLFPRINYYFQKKIVYSREVKSSCF